MRIKKAAEVLGVSEIRVLQMIQEGKLRATKKPVRVIRELLMWEIDERSVSEHLPARPSGRLRKKPAQTLFS